MEFCSYVIQLGCYHCSGCPRLLCVVQLFTCIVADMIVDAVQMECVAGRGGEEGVMGVIPTDRGDIRGRDLEL